MNFSDLSLIPELLRAIEKEGYTIPTPIQEKAIPAALAGRDVLGCAQTGTGKTAAFALPILQQLYEDMAFHSMTKKKTRPIRALIMTPTRELAIQIGESFAAYGRFSDLRTTVIFGGVSQQGQTHDLKRGVDIVVATPGRLNDLIGQGYVDLTFVQHLVLDEADRMLDMGFIHDVKRVLAYLPSQKQTLFFSATMPREIEELVASLLHDPEEVFVDPVSSTVDLIQQSMYLVDKKNKIRLLIHLLEDESITSALIFTRTKRGADVVAKRLGDAGIRAQAIHGDKSQNARQRALSGFKEGRVRILVATDIAARGIDIDGLSHAFNYDLPEVPETYVHRIGRTGRAGLDGTAISFCCIDEMSYLKGIEKLIGKTIEKVEDHPYPMEILEPTDRSLLPQNQRRRQRELEMANSDSGKKSDREQSSRNASSKKNQHKDSEKNSQKSSPKAPQKKKKQGESYDLAKNLVAGKTSLEEAAARERPSRRNQNRKDSRRGSSTSFTPSSRDGRNRGNDGAKEQRESPNQQNGKWASKKQQRFF